MDVNMFERAARLALRFETPAGHLAVEDLWRLPLTGRGPNLDDIAIALDKQLAAAGSTTSFVRPAESNKTDGLQLRFDIVKHIIDVLVDERDAAKAAQERTAKKQRIMEILARREDETLASAPAEDLRKMLAEL